MRIVENDRVWIELEVVDENGEPVAIDPEEYRRLFFDAFAFPFRRGSRPPIDTEPE